MEQRGIGDRGYVELFPGDGRANHREDARADDGSDAQRSERPWTKGLLEPVLRFFRVPDQLVDRLAGKKLAGQGSSPHPVSCAVLSVACPGGCDHGVRSWV